MPFRPPAMRRLMINFSCPSKSLIPFGLEFLMELFSFGKTQEGLFEEHCEDDQSGWRADDGHTSKS
jgi:hypothetical protein